MSGELTHPGDLQALIAKGISLPPLSPHASELIHLTLCPPEEVDLKRIAQGIGADPGLTTRMLRLANSPYFGISRQVSSVSHAISLIGARQTVEFITYTLIKDTTSARADMEGFSREVFWRHSLACATVARLLGNPQYLVKALPGELYLAGLLHDIGKMVMVLHLPDVFSKSLEVAAGKDIPLHEAERQLLGFDHAELGAQTLDEWDLPSAVQGAVGLHHWPEGAMEEFKEMASLLQLADMIAHVLQAEEPPEDPVAALSGAAVVRDESSSLSRPDVLTRLLEQAAKEVEVNEKMAHGADADDEAEPAGTAGEQETRPSPPTSRPGGGWLSRLWRRGTDRR